MGSAFQTRGFSAQQVTAMPVHTIHVITHTHSHTPFAVSEFALIRSGNNKEGERKRRRVSEQTEGGRKFNLFGGCEQKVLQLYVLF